MGLRYTAGFDGYNAYTKQIHDYEIEIDDINFTGEPIDLKFGGNPMEEEKENIGRDSYPALVPSFLNLNLIATDTFNLNQMFTDNERALKVTMKMDGKVWGKYFVIPDGSSEFFVDPPYDVSIRCVDGLGLLKNYQYTSNEGQASILQVVKRCLDKLDLGLNINTYSTLLYRGLSVGSDPYFNTTVNQERFIDMNCEEVLSELLKEWASGLVQINGEWFLFRYPDVIKTEGEIAFRKYNSALNYLENETIHIDLTLGNRSGDVIHCNTNQMRSVNMPYKSVSVKYKYGFIKNLLNRDARFMYGASSFEFLEWDKAGVIDVSTRRKLDGGDPYAVIRGHTQLPVAGSSVRLKNLVAITDVLTIKLEATFNAGYANGLPWVVAWRSGSTGEVLTLKEDGTWSTGSNIRFFYDYKQISLFTHGLNRATRQSETFTVPGVGEIRVIFFPPLYFGNNLYSPANAEVKIYEVSLFPSRTDEDILSETHKTTNLGDYTNVPSTIEVSTGESIHSFHLGTMYKKDGITPTDGFSEDGGATYKPFLDIASKDILVQHGRPSGRYEGSVLGIFSFLSRIKINEWHNPDSVFMPVSLRYDFLNCIVDSVLSEVKLTGIDYVIEPTKLEYQEPKEGGIKDVG